ncbi:GntR family transcriptional regulator [Diplocloster agilis]|uniref:GntR family transcriptional regulator n=1 Tax=Diplocloster agilis TaxID=2850323 RepID=A0A949NA19_9FIRM|nr:MULTISPECIES: GntR family transcriptional regulator [Lachnospiraceae]MBU9735992.1 GntR family transcriptional regulator [Diplocloster agilis]MBU9745453.1 GntR family transcriptional regulator [Diplocloster agilis]MCU6732901.1 GntR family transcriptional regulator [Suonthocola fibrivorans]SCI66409.1 trehalose operon repressor [uncultured Clostridium sp.]
MKLEFEEERPIFIQIAEGIEDAILSQAFPEESQIPSITEFSVTYQINPATALKGINLLVEEGIVYKKRGVGMFVSKGAVQVLREKRKEQFYDRYIRTMVDEAKRLQLSPQDIVNLIERGFEG